MLNIMLVDIFYQLNPGALLQSLVLTGALVYLLSTYYQEITSFLFKVHDNPTSKKFSKWPLPVLSSLLAFLFILFASRSVPKEYPVFGAYKVKNMILNGKSVTPDSCAANDSVLSRLYFDINNVCVMEYNSPNRRMMENQHFFMLQFITGIIRKPN
jgi:hypothetical protein